MSPKTRVFLSTKSTEFPAKDLTAGMDVIAAIKSTKIKRPLALVECGRNGMETIPAIGNTRDKKSSKESDMDI